MVKLERILVVGGGLTGMSAAIVLARAGYAVELIEQDPDWRALGAGITVVGATLRALKAVGVVDAVLAAGYSGRSNHVYRYTGELLFTRPAMQLPDVDLPGSGGILRPVLHQILAAEVRSSGVHVRLGVTYTDLAQDPGGVDVEFSDGTRRRYGLVVAADGLQSGLRQRLFPTAPAPQFTGQGCWRLIAERPPEVDRSSFYIGAAVTVGAVPISREQLYVWLLEHVPGNPRVAPETQHLKLGSLLQGFGGLPGRLRDELHTQSTIVYRPLEALLLPLPWWHGRILLCGDAAHATTPHLASGAGIGIEDAVVLAQELGRADTLDEALQAHGARRFPRCRLVVESSIEIGRVEMAGQSGRIHELMNTAQAAVAQPF